MSDNSPTVIKIIPTKEKIRVDWEVQVLLNKKENGTLSCYLPGFEIYFSAKSEDMMRKKASMLTKFFFDHYLLDSKNQVIGFKRLMLDLNKKGFRDKRHSEVMYKSMRSLPFKASMENGYNTQINTRKRRNRFYYIYRFMAWV